MSNISGQLIKDSYNYVLQSDLITGVVYRIGGNVVENPKFISGLTVNQSFTYSDGSEFPGYVLTCDALGNAIWGPVSGATSGVVVTGGTFDYSGGTLTLGLSNGVLVPISGLQDIYVTGGVVSGNSIVFTYNDTNTFEVSGITSFNTFTSYTASTEIILNSKVDVSVFNQFAQDTNIALNNRVEIPTFTAYTASTQVQINNKLDTSGFTAYTATTQPLILNAVTGGTYSGGTLYLITNSGNTVQITGFSTTQSGGSSNLQYFVSASTPSQSVSSGDRWFNTTTGIELVWINDGDSQQWIQPFSVPGPAGQNYYDTTGITSSHTITWDKTYWGISGSTNVNLSLPTTSNKDGYYIIIKDESGLAGTYRIRLTPSVGLIDGNNYVDMNINYMSLTCMVRNGNWYLI